MPQIKSILCPVDFSEFSVIRLRVRAVAGMALQGDVVLAARFVLAAALGVLGHLSGFL